MPWALLVSNFTSHRASLYSSTESEDWNQWGKCSHISTSDWLAPVTYPLHIHPMTSAGKLQVSTELMAPVLKLPLPNCVLCSSCYYSNRSLQSPYLYVTSVLGIGLRIWYSDLNLCLLDIHGARKVLFLHGLGFVESWSQPDQPDLILPRTQRFYTFIVLWLTLLQFFLLSFNSSGYLWCHCSKYPLINKSHFQFHKKKLIRIALLVMLFS